ncbi:MAG TPA: hypothetical protein VF578_07610 [Methylomirabilota bacterium]
MRVGVLLIAVLLGMFVDSPDASAQRLTPLSPGWDRYFSVTSEPFERRGKPYLGGSIVNTYGVMANRVQLLVDSLDSSGQIVAQRVEWLVGSNLPGFSTTYFEVPIREPAASYRVSVFAFDFVQSARLESP